MNNDKKVSIIIPTYNRADYLSKAIESSLTQDYEFIEVIVSDNASTDSTCEIVKKYITDPRFKYYRNENNLGFQKNFKKALYEYASGNFAVILSDDDFFVDENFISKAIGIIEKYDNIKLVCGNYLIKNEKKNTLQKSNIVLPEFINGYEYFINYRRKNYPHIHSTFHLFDREAAMAVKAFDNDIYGLDTVLWLKLMLLGNVGFIKDYIVLYRVHGGNSSNEKNISKELNDVGELKRIFIEASKKRVGNDDELRRWLKRQVICYFEWRYKLHLANGDRRVAYELFRNCYKEYQFLIWTLLKVNNILLFILGKNIKYVSKVKNYIRFLLLHSRRNKKDLNIVKTMSRL